MATYQKMRGMSYQEVLRTNLVFGGTPSVETTLSLQRRAACKPENLQAAFKKQNALNNSFKQLPMLVSPKRYNENYM